MATSDWLNGERLQSVPSIPMLVQYPFGLHLIEAAREESREGFAHSEVPVEATGSATKIFFIVAGTLCGLPTFVLASNVAVSLGIRAAVTAFLVGGAILAVLGAFSAYTGARTRMTLALIAEATFGTRGARVVQLTIALSTIGWFAVIISVLGAIISDTIVVVYDIRLPAASISIPLCVLIALIAQNGVTSMHKLGTAIIPLTVVLLGVAVVRTMHSTGVAPVLTAGTALNFSNAVSAVVGAYVVGVIIQPDYSRFVRRPSRAAVAEIAALGVAFPAILILSALPTVALAKPDLIAALIALGLGLPALVLLVLGAWIDATSCLYSGSLALAVLFRKLRFGRIVHGVAFLSAILALVHAERHFLTFLQVLGISLPPLAAVQCATVLLSSRAPRQATSRFDTAAFFAWGLGIAAGVGSQQFGWTLTGMAVLDSVIAAALATAGLRKLR